MYRAAYFWLMAKDAPVLHVYDMRARVDEDAIRQLVHAFYSEVQQDRVLAPIFASRIADEEWPSHLERMCNFWSTALLGTGRYRGNPQEVHAGIAELQPQHFDRWLELFSETASKIFPEAVARSIMSRAQRMGVRLKVVSIWAKLPESRSPSAVP